MNVKENEASFRYLFELQESGRTNMFGARPYLQAEMGLDKSEATEILSYWMKNYDEVAKELGIDV